MRLLIIILLSCCVLSVSAQKHDSVKYANGFLHYHEFGKGEPVILLTGGPGADYTQLETVARTLEPHYRAILLEQRGTGRSMPTPFDKATVNITTAMADLNLLMDQLKIPQAHLVGHSWGAMLSMTHAANFPQRVKSLVLISPGPFKLTPEVFGIYGANREARLTLEDQQRRKYIFDKVNSGSASKNEETEKSRWELAPMLYDRTKMDSLVTVINASKLNPQMGGFMFQSLRPDFTEGVQKFQKPIHIICGAQDPGAFVSYEAKIHLPQSKLHWINKCGHFPMFEQPNEFNKMLLSVMAEASKK